MIRMLRADQQVWSPLSVAEVIDALRPVPRRWWLSGGWAIEEYLARGNNTGRADGRGASRAHGDIDASVARQDWPAVLAAVHPRFEVWVARDGALHPVEQAGPADHNFWLRRRSVTHWQLQINLEDIDDAGWRYRRDPRIGRPTAQAAWWSGRAWCIAPAVQLLWKARAPRDVDEHDLRVTIGRLPQSERVWLGAAVRTAHPESPWATRPELR